MTARKLKLVNDLTELALVELLQKAFKQFGGKGGTDVEILRPRGIERVEISEKETK